MLGRRVGFQVMRLVSSVDMAQQRVVETSLAVEVEETEEMAHRDAHWHPLVVNLFGMHQTT